MPSNERSAEQQLKSEEFNRMRIIKTMRDDKEKAKLNGQFRVYNKSA